MWVFCCGMYRSASTLQFQITAQLVKDAGLGHSVGWIDANRFAEVRQAHPAENELKVVKVHLCTDLMVAEFRQANALGIYAFRDMRDVYASMMKQRQKSFEFLWNEGFIDTCLDNYHRWTTLPNVLISTYEDILANLPHEVERIATHLGISISAQRAQEMATSYTVEAQRERIEDFKSRLLNTPLNPHDHREIVDYHDEENLLHINHIDAVKLGRWKDDLSLEQVALIEQRVSDWCATNGYMASTFLPELGQQLLAAS